MLVRIEPQTPLVSLIMSPSRGTFLSALPKKWIVIVEYMDDCSRNFPRIIRCRFRVNRTQILIIARILIIRTGRTKILLRRFTFRVIHPPALTKGTHGVVVSTGTFCMLIFCGKNLVFISWRGREPTTGVTRAPLYFRLKLNSSYLWCEFCQFTSAHIIIKMFAKIKQIKYLLHFIKTDIIEERYLNIILLLNDYW